jgi:hypothetical protein
MEVCADADFSGTWHAEESWDRDTARSRHGFMVMRAGCPMPWKSQLRAEVALSSTESEHAGLSHKSRDAMPTMKSLKKMKASNFPIQSATPMVHCKVFEDDSGALEIASAHKFRSRTKHLNVKLHFFRDCVIRKEITVNAIHASQQLADCLTKPDNEETPSILRRQVMGWQRSRLETRGSEPTLGADSTAVNEVPGAFNKFFGHSNSSQQTVVNSGQQQLTKFWGHSTNFGGHSTAVDKVSVAFNSSQHDTAVDKVLVAFNSS